MCCCLMFWREGGICNAKAGCRYGGLLPRQGGMLWRAGLIPMAWAIRCGFCRKAVGGDKWCEPPQALPTMGR